MASSNAGLKNSEDLTEVITVLETCPLLVLRSKCFLSFLVLRSLQVEMPYLFPGCDDTFLLILSSEVS